MSQAPDKSFNSDLSSRERTRFLKRFDQLTELAHQLIGEGKMKDAAIKDLIQQLEVFTQDTTALKKPKKALLPAQMQILSTLFADYKGMTLSGKVYVNANHIRYIGELYYVIPSTIPAEAPRWHQEIIKMLHERHRLPMKLDPMAAGWEPPYINALGSPVDTLGVSVQTAHDLEDLAISTIGQLIQWKKEDLVAQTIRGHKFSLQATVEIEKRLSPLGLFLNMRLPPRLKRQYPTKTD